MIRASDITCSPMTASSVTGNLRYLESARHISAIVPSVGGEEKPELENPTVDVPVSIRDGRGHTGQFQLDRQGFCLQSMTSAVDDFYDDDQIRNIYENEVRTLLLTITGASQVEVFDHTRRAASSDIRRDRQVREPATSVHCDYTPLSGIQRLLDHYRQDADEVIRLMKNRFAIVNVWRPVNASVETTPMAVCDARTLSPGDLVPVKRMGRDRLGEIQQALPNPQHAWYYFPRMTRNEALLIKTYDSDPKIPARFTLHTAFEDPTSPPGAAPRESIETRCFLFFESEEK